MNDTGTDYAPTLEGPWIVKDNGGPDVQVFDAGYEVCTVWNAGPETGSEDVRVAAMKAAQLIAAAPALAAALKPLLADVRSGKPGCCLAAFKLSEYNAAVAALRDAGLCGS